MTWPWLQRLRDMLGRTWAHQKLARGRCEWCRKPLTDDTRGQVCESFDCQQAVMERQAW